MNIMGTTDVTSTGTSTMVKITNDIIMIKALARTMAVSRALSKAWLTAL